jgi:multiple sugar transport system substrate-binding protein
VAENEEDGMPGSTRGRVLGVGAVAALALSALSGGLASAQDELSGPLRVDFLAYDAKMQPWLDELQAEFTALHPNVELTLEIPNLDQYRDSLTTQVQGGSPPDLAQVATSWQPALAEAGALVDWETVLDPAILEAMDPTLRDGARFQGTLYGLSYGSSSRAVFYNQPAWDAASLSEPPADWEAFLDAARQMKAGGVEIPFYYEGKGQEGMAAWFPYVYFSYGGELEQDGKLVIDQEACVQGLTVWDTMNKEGLFEPDVTAGDFNQQRATMTGQTAGMTMTGPWLIGMYAEDNPEAEFGAFQIPTGTVQATVGVTDAYILFADSPNQAAAVAFAEFVMDKDKNLRFIRDRGFLPIYTEHFSLPEFQEGPIKPFVDALPNAKFVPINASWVEFDKIGTDAITAMFLDGTGPEVACQTMVDGLAGLEQ